MDAKREEDRGHQTNAGKKGLTGSWCRKAQRGGNAGMGEGKVKVSQPAPVKKYNGIPPSKKKENVSFLRSPKWTLTTRLNWGKGLSREDFPRPHDRRSTR